MTIVKNRDAIPLCHPAATKRSGACIHLVNGAPGRGKQECPGCHPEVLPGHQNYYRLFFIVLPRAG